MRCVEARRNAGEAEIKLVATRGQGDSPLVADALCLDQLGDRPLAPSRIPDLWIAAIFRVSRIPRIPHILV